MPQSRTARPAAPHAFRFDAATATLLARLITASGLHKACPRRVCKRARVCVAPGAPCYWSDLEVMQQTLRPMLQALADALPDGAGDDLADLPLTPQRPAGPGAGTATASPTCPPSTGLVPSTAPNIVRRKPGAMADSGLTRRIGALTGPVTR